MDRTSALAKAFCPEGRLRASINFGNPLLARRGEGGRPEGVSVALARALAEELGLGCDFLTFDASAASVAALREGRADLGFFAVDPARSEGLRFTRPYLLTEGSYLVRVDSPIRSNADVDRDGVRVVVGKGTAYDLFLSRALAKAAILRVGTSHEVVPAMLAEGCEVAAGIRQQLESDAREHGGLRLLDGRFMVIEQAMAIPAGRGEEAGQALDDFLARAKASGLLASALGRFGVVGATIAP